VTHHLGEVGLGKAAIVSATSFVTNLSKKAETDAAWTAFFGEGLPARATVGRRSRRRRLD
jgi:enamine deaminase RidA (YjgF/YER057c/UK114 family)